MTLTIPLLLTFAALCAVAIARWGIAASARRSPVAASLRTLYSLLAALLALRLATHFLSSPLLTALLMLVAAWLPLAGLRLVEQLRRRHAPRPVKLAVLAGAAGFSFVAVTAGLFWAGPILLALAAYQALAMAAMLVLLGTARKEMAPVERRTADTFLLALLLAIPLALTDFKILLPGAPVRGGPFAILILILATSRLASSEGSARQLARDVLIMLGGAALAGLAATAAMPGLSLAAAAGVAAAGGATAALALLGERFLARRAGGSSIIAALAHSPAQGGRDALLASHPMLATARVLDGEALAAYPEASLERLAKHRVVSEDIDDGEARDAARDLLEATGASHLLRLSRAPLTLLAVSAGGLAGPALDGELDIVARLLERER